MLPTWVKCLKPSAMQQMLEASSDPDLIRFSLGLPNPTLFPRSEIKESTENVFNLGPEAFQYSSHFSSLKEEIVKLMATRNLVCNKAQIFLTAGAQQAIFLLSLLLLNSKRSLITESFIYPGILQIVDFLSIKVVTYPVHNQQGPCLNSLETILKNQKDKPSFIYTIPAGHNPMGFSLNEAKKQKLASLARIYQIPLIEDDTYGFLYYDKPVPPLRAYEEKWTIYIGTFSKILAPSFRLGWIIASEDIITRLSSLKEMVDINTTSFTQNIVGEFLKKGFLADHLEKTRQIYKQYRNVMLESIHR